MGYDISATGYLKRAKEALQKKDVRNLFYAAFELRCCIETRQGEYANALLAYENVKVKPWNVKQTGQRIRRASYADRMALCRYHLEGETFDIYHTPVPDKLIKFVDTPLGNLLHAQQNYQELTCGKWSKIRNELLEIYRLAWLSCQGDSLVPPMWDKKSSYTHPFQIERTDRNKEFLDRLLLLQGKQLKMEISYPSKPPAEWVCDL
ncbi:MAG: hypothetical protein ABJP02_10400 [Parasphingorhabdus sp.]|uniref:hypothetical protein n=1 Tax=Parasphingorhabdus sp. TaxID=2709688 RepID=UPI0032731BFF